MKKNAKRRLYIRLALENRKNYNLQSSSNWEGAVASPTSLLIWNTLFDFPKSKANGLNQEGIMGPLNLIRTTSLPFFGPIFLTEKQQGKTNLIEANECLKVLQLMLTIRAEKKSRNVYTTYIKFNTKKVYHRNPSLDSDYLFILIDQYYKCTQFKRF